MKFLEIAWTLPQCVLGLIWVLFWKIKGKILRIEDYKGAQVFIVTDYITGWNGISLGFFIIYRYDAKNLKHEYGHYKQSLILGWFYLPFILFDYLIEYKTPHHKQLAERWADKLAE